MREESEGGDRIGAWVERARERRQRGELNRGAALSAKKIARFGPQDRAIRIEKASRTLAQQRPKARHGWRNKRSRRRIP